MVKQDGAFVNEAAYMIIGIDLVGNMGVLGMWIGENESAKFWLNVLNELKNHGVQDIITCVDNLTGFTQAITAGYPRKKFKMHHSPNPQFSSLCFLQGSQKVTANPKPI